MAGSLAAVPAYGQTNPEGKTYFVGKVETSGRHTLIVRGDDCRVQLYSYDSYSVKPATVTVGARVRVLSTPTGESDVRLAISVMPDTSTPPAPSPTALPCEPVPPQIWMSQREMERFARLWHWGIRGGVGLDPEILVVGAQTGFGPFFNRTLLIRPSFDFGWGQAVQAYAINLDMIIRWPGAVGAALSTKWYPYVGAGPHLTFEELSVGRLSSGFHSVVGLNLLGGLEYRSGVFMEGRVSVYSKPTSEVKVLVGYNF